MQPCSRGQLQQQQQAHSAPADHRSSPDWQSTSSAQLILVLTISLRGHKAIRSHVLYPAAALHAAWAVIGLCWLLLVQAQLADEHLTMYGVSEGCGCVERGLMSYEPNSAGSLPKPAGIWNAGNMQTCLSASGMTINDCATHVSMLREDYSIMLYGTSQSYVSLLREWHWPQ